MYYSFGYKTVILFLDFYVPILINFSATNNKRFLLEINIYINYNISCK